MFHVNSDVSPGEDDDAETVQNGLLQKSRYSLGVHEDGYINTRDISIVFFVYGFNIHKVKNVVNSYIGLIDVNIDYYIPESIQKVKNIEVSREDSVLILTDVKKTEKEKAKNIGLILKV